MAPPSLDLCEAALERLRAWRMAEAGWCLALMLAAEAAADCACAFEQVRDALKGTSCGSPCRTSSRGASSCLSGHNHEMNRFHMLCQVYARQSWMSQARLVQATASVQTVVQVALGRALELPSVDAVG